MGISIILIANLSCLGMDYQAEPSKDPIVFIDDYMGQNFSIDGIADRLEICFTPTNINGTNANRKHNGAAPLHRVIVAPQSIEWKKKMIIKLLSLGARINEPDDLFKRTPLDWAVDKPTLQEFIKERGGKESEHEED